MPLSHAASLGERLAFLQKFFHRLHDFASRENIGKEHIDTTIEVLAELQSLEKRLGAHLEQQEVEQRIMYYEGIVQEVGKALTEALLSLPQQQQ